jgi:methylglyoxal synthase
MEEIKRIALVAHDNRKKDLIEWAEWNYEILIHHQLISTGTTGRLLEKSVNKRNRKAKRNGIEPSKY